MKKTSLLVLAVANLLNSAAMAASPSAMTTSQKSALNVARVAGRRATGVTIFNNLATLDPDGVYTVGSGTGFGNVTANAPPVKIAAAFTPSQNATVTEIDVGAGYISGTLNAIKVHLYQDAAGVPGTEIWSHETALPVDGTCCAVAAIVLKTQSVKLTAGQQYWLGLGVAGGAADTFAAWYGNVADQVDTGLSAINQGSGWTSSPALPLAAFGVFGK